MFFSMAVRGEAARGGLVGLSEDPLCEAGGLRSWVGLMEPIRASGTKVIPSQAVLVEASKLGGTLRVAA
jgi:hypothetical protein